jgi:hypothetical protein
MYKICHAEHSEHFSINHWTHMGEMKWSSRAMLCVLAAKNLSFGFDLSSL